VSEKDAAVPRTPRTRTAVVAVAGRRPYRQHVVTRVCRRRSVGSSPPWTTSPPPHDIAVGSDSKVLEIDRVERRQRGVASSSFRSLFPLTESSRGDRLTRSRTALLSGPFRTRSPTNTARSFAPRSSVSSNSLEGVETAVDVTDDVDVVSVLEVDMPVVERYRVVERGVGGRHVLCVRTLNRDRISRLYVPY